MANNWYSGLFGNSNPADPSTFDYDTATQKVQRQRAAAQALQSMGMQTNQGQFIKSGDFTGYAGGNTLGSTMARLVAAALSVPANDAADNAQKQLGLDSQHALTWALDPNNSPAARRAIADQNEREADADKQREVDRMNNTVQGGDYMDPNAQQGPASVETSPVSMPGQGDITPMPSAVTRAAAKVLAKPQATAAAGKPTGQPIPVTGGPQSMGTGANFNLSVGPKTNLPTNASGPLSADDAAFVVRMLGGAPAGNTAGTSPNVTQSISAPSSASAYPTAAMQPTAPSNAPQPQATGPLVQPMPPQAPTLEDRARAVGIDPTAPRGPGDPSLEQQVQQVEAVTRQLANGQQPVSDPRSMNEQAAARANANASYGDQMANLQQIARTGPMGQQLANAMMQSQFSKDWGEIKNADGATVGVYNKRDPSQTMAFPGQGIGVKQIGAINDLVSKTDPTNPAAMDRLNATLAQMGVPPMSPDQVRGMGMTADQRANVTKGAADSISSITQKRGEAATQVADLGKINRDLQTAMGLANQAAGKWTGIGGSIAQWLGGGADQQMLNRILNDSMLMSIMQDKGGQGSAGVGLMKAYQDHGLKATMQPEALQQGLQQIQQAIQERIAAKQGEVQAHDYALGQLGYHPQQQPQQTGSGTSSSGRAPGNYSF